MSLSFDVYWSFRSPYSYLVTPRLLDLAARHHVVCQVRPVYPLAVRTPEFFDTRDTSGPPTCFATSPAKPSSSACRSAGRVPIRSAAAQSRAIAPSSPTSTA